MAENMGAAAVAEDADMSALIAEWDSAVASAGGDESESTTTGGEGAAAGEGAGADAGAADAAQDAEREAKAKADQEAAAKGQPTPPPGKENWIPQARANWLAEQRRKAEKERDDARKEANALKARLDALEAGRAQPGATADPGAAGEPGFDVDAWMAGKDQADKSGEGQPAAGQTPSEVAAIKAELAKLARQVETHGKTAAQLAEYRDQQALHGQIEQAREAYCPDVPPVAFAKALTLLSDEDAEKLDLFALGEVYRAEIDKAKAKYPEVEGIEPGFWGRQFAANPRANLMAAGQQFMAAIAKVRAGYVKADANGQAPGTRAAPPRPAGMGAPPPRHTEDQGPQSWDDANNWAEKAIRESGMW